MNDVIKTEQELFDELESLCKSPGYLHAIAYFCFRDNTIRYKDGEMVVDDVVQQFSFERLVRTEISTLIGLACKKQIDINHPGPKCIQEHIDKTETLLKNLHKTMIPPLEEIFDKRKIGDPSFNPFRTGKALRESIFYGGEAAYNFQYRDLALIKYKNDSAWFQKNKGYSIGDAAKIVSSLLILQNDKISNLIPTQLKTLSPEEWTMLPAFVFSDKELSEKSGVDLETTKSFLDSFVCPPEIDRNQFSALDDFNPMNAYPIIRASESEFILFQNYGLLEALYETPFFWFNADDTYKVKARENRGLFTESFSEKRLKIVFGEDRVFTNVDIYKDKQTRVGEIDVLVVFANRAIILQAKSKKLTIAARKGNDNSLQEDFKKAVQDSYNQAYQCAEYLNNENYRLVDSSGNELKIYRKFESIYPFCVVSDHYPALSFQARQFLKYQATTVIKYPFIMDVFLLNVMTEMLQSPLHFLSYVNRRVEYAERILSNHELTILSYHLKQNLWIDDDTSMIQLGDDICADLDLAMLTRRNGAPGIETPEGILTKYRDTTYGQLIAEIDRLDDPATIDLGFILLSLSGETIEQINEGIDQLYKLHKEDGEHHDLTLCIDQGKTGLTIHCNSDKANIAATRLKIHCEKRKYTLKADTWFGLCLDPVSRKIKFGLELEFDWVQSDEMDQATKNLPKPQNIKNGGRVNFSTKRRNEKKTGRNDPCPCGSQKKYKNCCLA
nr:nuclease-related domain-containing protein [Pseudomonas alcaliphila]